MDFFDKAYSNLGKMWDAMWDTKTRKPKRGKRPGRRAISQSRLERYTEAFLTDDRSYEDNQQVATKDQKRAVRKFLKQRAAATPAPTDLTEIKPLPPPKKDQVKDDRTPEEKEAQIPKSSELTERIEKAQERVEKVDKSWPEKKNRLLFQPKLMGTLQRRMLFMNPGDEKIQMAVYAILHSMALPSWAAPTPRNSASKPTVSILTFSGNRCRSPTATKNGRRSSDSTSIREARPRSSPLPTPSATDSAILPSEMSRVFSKPLRRISETSCATGPPRCSAG